MFNHFHGYFVSIIDDFQCCDVGLVSPISSDEITGVESPISSAEITGIESPLCGCEEDE